MESLNAFGEETLGLIFFFLFGESTQDSVAAKVCITRADGCEKDIQLHRDNREKQRGREQGNVWKQQGIRWHDRGKGRACEQKPKPVAVLTSVGICWGWNTCRFLWTDICGCEGALLGQTSLFSCLWSFWIFTKSCFFFFKWKSIT